MTSPEFTEAVAFLKLNPPLEDRIADLHAWLLAAITKSGEVDTFRPDYAAIDLDHYRPRFGSHGWLDPAYTPEELAAREAREEAELAEEINRGFGRK